MKKLLLALLLLAFCGTAHAQVSGGWCPGSSTADRVYADEVITVSSTALPFTAATYAPAGGPTVKYAIVVVETNPIRAKSTGIAPTAAVGVPKAVGSEFPVCGQLSVQRFLAIRTGSDASITVQYVTGQ